MTAPDVRDDRPVYGIRAQNPPPKLPLDDRKALKAYANLVRWLYPGPVGAWVARDLEAIAEFGYRFANPGLLAELLTGLDAERDRRVAEARATLRVPGPERGCERRGASGGGTMPAAAQTFASGELSPPQAYVWCGCTTSRATGRAITYPSGTTGICTEDDQ